MKTIVAIACLLAFASLAHSFRTSDTLQDVLVIDGNEAELLRAMQLRTDGSEEEHEAFALVEWNLLPSKADGLIAKVKEVKGKAKEFAGYKNFNLVRALDTNVRYWLWLHWDSKQKLLEYIESDAGKILKQYAHDKDIVYHATPIEPLV